MGEPRGVVSNTWAALAAELALEGPRGWRTFRSNYTMNVVRDDSSTMTVTAIGSQAATSYCLDTKTPELEQVAVVEVHSQTQRSGGDRSTSDLIPNLDGVVFRVVREAELQD